MQAITTKYLGPTNTRGSRVKASAKRGQSLTLHWDYALNANDNHKAAAKALATKLGWNYAEWFEGSTEDGNVYVCADAAAFTVEGTAL